jgi:hypothetical protein
MAQDGVGTYNGRVAEERHDGALWQGCGKKREELRAAKWREREIDLPKTVAKLLVEFIGDRKTALLFCTRNGNQLSQSNILRRHLHPALEEIGFEKAGNHAFRRYRDTFLRNRTNCPAFFTSGLAGAARACQDTTTKSEMTWRSGKT